MKRLHVPVETLDQPIQLHSALVAAPQTACCPRGPEAVT